jgi:putative copper export protein
MESVFGVESPAYVAIRALLSICSIGLLGALALRWAVLARYAGPDAEPLRAAVDARLPLWIDGLGITAVVATLARLAAQHVAVFGTDATVSGQTLGALLFRSGWGRSWWLALVAAVAVTWIAPRLRGRSRVAWYAGAGVSLLFAASQPWSGHPAAAAQPWRATRVQLLHLIGAGGWVGCLALLTFVAIPAARRIKSPDAGGADARIAGLVRAFSPTALVFAALLGTTGLFTAWENLGGFTQLWQSVYGRTLMVKLGFLSIAVATGAYNWRRVLPILGMANSSARLRRSSLIELTAALLVLATTAVLVATPMPGE